MDVLNPHAPELTFPTGRTRNRRDHEKYLTLIDAIALLHQYQREAKVLAHGQPNTPDGARRYIEVTLEDIALANRLAPEVLGRTLDELPPQTRRLLDQIRELMQSKRADSKKVGPGFAWFSRKELREACGWSLTQVRAHLERLVELECVAIRHGRLGSQFVYELLLDPAVPEAVAHVGLIDVECLRTATQTHADNRKVAGLARGVAEPNGHLAGGGESLVPPATQLAAVT
jgi:DNA primase